MPCAARTSSVDRRSRPASSSTSRQDVLLTAGLDFEKPRAVSTRAKPNILVDSRPTAEATRSQHSAKFVYIGNPNLIARIHFHSCGATEPKSFWYKPKFSIAGNKA